MDERRGSQKVLIMERAAHLHTCKSICLKIIEPDVIIEGMKLSGNKSSQWLVYLKETQYVNIFYFMSAFIFVCIFIL